MAVWNRDSRRWPSTVRPPSILMRRRQLPDGRWTSKLGKAEDIEHESPDDVAGRIYGEVDEFLKRSVEVV